MKIETAENCMVTMTVPHSLGFTMLWDTFHCELKAARISDPGTPLRRSVSQNARQAARLMIELSGRADTLPRLRQIAGHVKFEVGR